MTEAPETGLRALLADGVRQGQATGVVGLVARGGAAELAVAGSRTLGGPDDIAPDTVFRLASLTKMVTAAAVLLLVDEGRIALRDPVARWLPELAAPMVVRTPDAPADDVLPAVRPITVCDLLTARAGWGFPADFSLPAVQALVNGLRQNPPGPDGVPAPDDWLADLARIPLLHQPGEQFLYNTTSDVQGVLIARVTGQPLAEFLAERFFEPLGMADSAFSVPAAKLDRFTALYRPGEADGGAALSLWDAPDGQWSREPAFASGAGGLVGTAGDVLAFLTMVLERGKGPDGRRILTPESVRLMSTDHLTAGQREAGSMFLEGQGWGFGGSVDVEPSQPWNVPGRYGWIGGTGTAAHLTPSTGTIAILLTNAALAGPSAPPLMTDFWRYAARR
ncbi:serine hydrolase domain-containing protein [Streptomyces qinzhouensis]|uniref:Beta-lactamase family protein n=1 Tax=Streptomyces qinzhouensis TaxID=2599401 RepID=A0A5B8JBS1_9ACTN|nr:serine hydrolase domain-containing protein [Streptomyces qinzhouensis]QDY77341.1 beta-lactamase family protein [Streptomyces qinzhouensis]